MSGKRHSRLYRATALVPLAVLSAAWTVNVTGLGGTNAAASSDTSPTSGTGVLPDGTPLPPAIGLDHPASVSAGQTQQLTGVRASQLVDSASTSGIPAAALAAYQRAATVIDAADTTCHIPWQLIAAIGRVESDHGRANGNTLTSQGISTPGIFGPVLDGRNGTALIRDTDGGALDGDTTYDRAVGPLQFIPSTWSIVAVDADGDGKRNPQDINDAALAAAVYLCSGPGDLSGEAGQRTAVYRFNHSWSYVGTVLGIEHAYLGGNYTSVPNSTVDSQPFVAAMPTYTGANSRRGTRTTASAGSSHATGAGSPGTSGSTSGGGSTSPAPSKAPTPTPTKPPTSPSPIPSVPAPVPTKTVTDTAATVAQLTDVCTTALKQAYPTLTGDSLNKAVGKCVTQLQGQTLTQAKKNVASVVAGLADFIKNLLGGVGGLVGGGLGG